MNETMEPKNVGFKQKALCPVSNGVFFNPATLLDLHAWEDLGKAVGHFVMRRF